MKPVAIAVLLVWAALLAACSSPQRASFELTDITGAAFARDFKLTDHTGKTRTLADFKGKVVVVFFGYTHCPDVCPATLSELASIMKELGPDAQRLQVLFVTVDPERDTPALLAQYVPAFDPSFLGLYGDATVTADTLKEFKVVAQKQPTSNGSYTVDHTAGSYIFDPSGRVRLFATYGGGAQPLLHDIRILLNSTG